MISDLPVPMLRLTAKGHVRIGEAGEREGGTTSYLCPSSSGAIPSVCNSEPYAYAIAIGHFAQVHTADSPIP